jgi:O-antigen/teichoic acid export membrane protein
MQATVLVSLAGALLGIGYLLVLRVVSPDIAAVFGNTTEAAVFVVIVAASGVNLLSDGILLSVDALGRNLLINGVLMGGLKCALPFALAQLGAFGLVTSVGLASVVAAVLSMVVAFSRLPPDQDAHGSGLRRALGFTGAGYAASVINMLPVLVMPLLVVEMLDAADNAVYFIAFQIVSLLNAAAYSINASSFAHASRTPEEGKRVVSSALRMSLGTIVLGGFVLAVLAPWLLLVFGPQYRDEGTWALRFMALASVPLALENWYSVRLRLRLQLWSMVVQQAVVSTVMLVSAYFLLPLGLEWAAVSIGSAYLLGSAFGWFTTRGDQPEVVRIGEDEPGSEPQPVG